MDDKEFLNYLQKQQDYVDEEKQVKRQYAELRLNYHKRRAAKRQMRWEDYKQNKQLVSDTIRELIEELEKIITSSK